MPNHWKIAHRARCHGQCRIDGQHSAEYTRGSVGNGAQKRSRGHIAGRSRWRAERAGIRGNASRPPSSTIANRLRVEELAQGGCPPRQRPRAGYRLADRLALPSTLIA